MVNFIAHATGHVHSHSETVAFAVLIIAGIALVGLYLLDKKN